MTTCWSCLLGGNADFYFPNIGLLPLGSPLFRFVRRYCNFTEAAIDRNDTSMMTVDLGPVSKIIQARVAYVVFPVHSAKLSQPRPSLPDERTGRP